VKEWKKVGGLYTKFFRNAKTPIFNIRNANGRYKFLLMRLLFSDFYTTSFLSVLFQDDISLLIILCRW